MKQFRIIIFLVALLNFLYFWVEYGVAIKIESVSLFADSIDFLEDSAINILILLSIGLSLYRRSQIGILLSLIILIPSATTLWMVVEKFLNFTTPEPFTLTLVGFGALVINSICALLLVRFRKEESSLVKAAFLSARNDVFANIAIICSGFVTMFWYSMWPDLIVGVCIFLMNLDASKAVYQSSKKERFNIV